MIRNWAMEWRQVAERRGSQPSDASQPAPVLGLRPGGGPMGMFRETEHARDRRGTLVRLWGYVQRQRWALIGTAFLVVITSAADRPARS